VTIKILTLIGVAYCCRTDVYSALIDHARDYIEAETVPPLVSPPEPTRVPMAHAPPVIEVRTPAIEARTPVIEIRTPSDNPAPVENRAMPIAAPATVYETSAGLEKVSFRRAMWPLRRLLPRPAGLRLAGRMLLGDMRSAICAFKSLRDAPVYAPFEDRLLQKCICISVQAFDLCNSLAVQASCPWQQRTVLGPKADSNAEINRVSAFSS
jgi:hypothetical protein